MLAVRVNRRHSYSQAKAVRSDVLIAARAEVRHTLCVDGLDRECQPAARRTSSLTSISVHSQRTVVIDFGL